ncbi:MAG: ParM/StbA family protein [Gloeomargarita sp. SKYB31]|nr:ParM/StbA family protein [Gloeomargarita sp. SKYB31]
MNIGLDVGYSHTKAVTGDRPPIIFPSVVGTPDKARFSLTTENGIVLTYPRHVQVGAGAVTQSRFLQRREDRHWVESEEWLDLALAALTELTTATFSELRIVTGLPVAFFADRKVVRDRLLGTHKVQREDRHAQTFRVVDCAVIPQPFGTLLAATLDDRGRIANQALAAGTVGVIDIGGKTTNLLSVNRLTEISHETASVNVGAWDAVRAVQSWLADRYPGLEELRPHQVIDVIISRQVKYYGQTVNLGALVEETLEPLADQILAEASQLWNGGATLDAILVTGGGALLLGQYIRRHFRHAMTVEDPVFANARGYWRLAQRRASQPTQI